jgi:hypothetical protein
MNRSPDPLEIPPNPEARHLKSKHTDADIQVQQVATL